MSVPAYAGPDPAPPPPAAGGLWASTAVVTAANVASRVTGFLRVLVVGAVLGVTFVGNTYQSANLVSNVVFELVAAGALSAVLVPTFVRLLAEGRRGEAEALAGQVLGLALLALGALVALGLLLRPWVMGALTAAVDDPAVRRREVALGSFLLVAFLPQLLLYATGAVATGLLHASGRFAAAALAPVANNLTVIATLAAFAALGPAGATAGLDLTGPQRWVLAGGTTAGVAAMTALPVLALRRTGLALRPRLGLAHPALRGLGRRGLWASLHLGLGQVLVVTTVVVTNRVEGGVVAATLAYQVFLLPYALLAHPLTTALYPRLSGPAGAASNAGPLLDRGTRVLGLLLAPATLLSATLALPALRVMEVGGLDGRGTALAARAVAAYALGIGGWAALQLFTRASYALDDARTPALVMAGVAVGGAGAMVLGAGLTEGEGAVVAVAGAHAAAVVAGGAVLAVLVRRRLGQPVVVATSLGRTAAATVVAGAAVVATLTLLGAPGGLAGAGELAGRPAAALTTLAAGLAGAGAFFAARLALARRRPRAADPELLGAPARLGVSGP